LRAIYGYVQASLLWHWLLIKVLKDMGFQQCEVDPCVMCLVDCMVVNVLMIYIDDLLLFATKVVVDIVLQKLKKAFQWLTVERGVIMMSFLGMQLVFRQDNIVVEWYFIWRVY
jgi:hypothetical protein